VTKIHFADAAESWMNEKEQVILEASIGQYLAITNRLRDYMVGPEKYEVEYVMWCHKYGEHMAARQNHTDGAVMST